MVHIATCQVMRFERVAANINTGFDRGEVVPS